MNVLLFSIYYICLTSFLYSTSNSFSKDYIFLYFDSDFKDHGVNRVSMGIQVFQKFNIIEFDRNF